MPFNVLDLISTGRVVIIDAATDRPDELLVESWERQIVELREKPVVFGRIPGLTGVCLPGRLVAKGLFEIRWNEKHNWHEVEVYPCVYPPSLNGQRLLGEEPSPLFIGDILTIGPFRIEYTVLKPLSEKQTET
jgi:hypothetical protein